MPQVAPDQVPLIISALALLVSLGSLIFTALTYRRGRPRLSAKLIVTKPVCWKDDIPRLLDVRVEVENRAAAETSVDSIEFELKDVVNDACAHTEWKPRLHGRFERESLKGYHTFRREFKVPTEMPEGAAGNPSILAEIKLGTNKTLTTRSRDVLEGVIAHFSHVVEEWAARRTRDST